MLMCMMLCVGRYCL